MSAPFDESIIPLNLNGNNLELKCTPLAMRSLSHALGGQVAALQGILEQRIETFITVIAAGTNKMTGRELDWINEQIFAGGGIEPIMDPVVLYIRTLFAGGRRPETVERLRKEQEEKDAAENPPKGQV